MRHPRKLHAGAARMQWTMTNIDEPLRAAEERADARRADSADLPPQVLKVEYRYEWPEGVNVYNVYVDNLSCFNVFTATPGSERDMALAELAEVQS